MKNFIMFLITLMLSFSVQNEIAINPDSAAATINDLFGNELRREVTADDIDFSKAVKIYVETDFEEYIYELPVMVDDKIIVLNIAKGRPLSEDVSFTEKEREQIIADEGRWIITALTLYPDFESYEKRGQ